MMSTLLGLGLRPLGRLKGLDGNPKRNAVPLSQLLFGNGEDGFLFGNFAEPDELFTTSVGPTNVAANDDPVGLALDDHSWAGASRAAIIAAATDIVVNGGFSADANWSKGTGWTITGGVAVHAPGIGSVLAQALVAVDGAAYYWTMTITRVAGSVNIGWVGTGTVFGYSIAASGTHSGIMVAPAGGALATLRVTADAAFDGTVDNVVIRRIPGNHASQLTAVNRPLWKANAGKPNLFYDGLNDALISSLYPLASGTGLTMAAAFNATNTANCAIGGGTPTGDKRAMLGLGSGGALAIGWGTEIGETVPVDRRNTNLVVIVTGDADGRDVWLDNIDITSLFAASSGIPDGTGGALTLGGRQNSVGGGPDRLMAGTISAALALNRRVTPAEIAPISDSFRSTFGI